MDDIVSGDIDIYAELQVDPNASSLEISRAYRKKALQYHPDKNPSPEAKTKFQLLTIINDILSDPELRTRYDSLRSEPKNTGHASRNERAQEFKVKLQKAETALKRKETQQPKVNAALLAKLEMEGLKLRQEFELDRTAEKEYVSFRDLEQGGPNCKILPTITSLQPSNKVVVKWKRKEGKDATIDDAILAEIMSIFGTVVNTQTGAFDGRYLTGTVTFEKPEYAFKAANYNYRGSAALWDGTRVRRVASLLRECTVVANLDSKIQEVFDRVSAAVDLVKDLLVHTGDSVKNPTFRTT